MPLPRDTAIATGESAGTDRRPAGVDFRHASRSLMLDRFANPELEKDDRRDFFNNAFDKLDSRLARAAVEGRREVLSTLPGLKAEDLIFAQLQSRLMVNMAGGVMENAGLCLDRFGLPYIPGSAVKGCARRMAIQRWLEMRQENKPVEALAAFLKTLALTFGWGDTDWKDGRKRGRNGRPGQLRSDLEFACGEGAPWQAVRDRAATMLLDHLGVRKRTHPNERWKDLPNFAGSVSFLPAYPVEVGGAELLIRPPVLGALELDVVTCHHPAYYRGDKDVATDDEDPNPVVFPAIAAGHVFAFAVRPLRDCSHDCMTQAHQWLTDGLATFGLGAKTAAGYGWFDTTPAIGEAVVRHLRARDEAQRKEREAQAEKERQRQAEETRKKAREELDKATANMSDEERLLYTFKQLQEAQFLSKLDRWKDLTAGERFAIYRLMRSDKSALWLDLRKKATEGKQKEKAQWGQLVQDLFKIAKDRKEKMPS